MSEDSKKLAQDAEFPDSDMQLDGIDTGEQEASMTIAPPKPGRMPVLLALLALVIAIVSLLASAWLFLGRAGVPALVAQDDTALLALSASLENTQKSVIDLAGRLDTLANREVLGRAELDNINRQLEQRLQQYASLPDRVGNMETSLSSIQGIATGVRDGWLLAEAEYYMQIANAQLQLAANPHLAKLALLQADERVQQLANPALTHVRRAMANELRALDLVTRPDIEGITLALASLADAVDALPLRSDVIQDTTADLAPQEDLSGFDRAVKSLKSTMSDVVSVRRTDEAVRPLIAPESAYFLRANLSLQLQAARLALLRSETAVYQQSLGDADAWLAEYFDNAAADVQRTRASIADLRGRLQEISKPDISESLRLLRQFNSLRKSAPVASSSPRDTPAPAQPQSNNEQADDSANENGGESADNGSDQ